MKRLFFILVLSIVAGIFCGRAQQKMTNDIWLYRVADSVFVHTTYTSIPEYGRFPSNGLIIVSKGNALLIDSPVTEELTTELLGFIRDSLHANVTHFIGCHWHEDCIGGLGFLNKAGVSTICLQKTKEICREKKLPLAATGFDKRMVFDFNGLTIQCEHPGGGHTIDNIVVYVKEMQVLFGGCLVKSLESTNLGNLVDAVPNEWGRTILNVMEGFPNAEVVVPGHGKYGGRELLSHTSQLVKTYQYSR